MCSDFNGITSLGKYICKHLGKEGLRGQISSGMCGLQGLMELDWKIAFTTSWIVVKLFSFSENQFTQIKVKC